MTNFETQRKTWFDALMWLYSSITYRSLSVSDGLPFIVESRKSQLDVRNRTKVEQAVSCTFSSFSKTDYEPFAHRNVCSTIPITREPSSGCSCQARLDSLGDAQPWWSSR